MSLRAVEQLCTGTTSLITSYNSSNWNLGPNIVKYSGTNDTDKFIGPNIVSIVRPQEQSTAISTAIMCGITWSSTIDWIFGLEAITTQTKRIVLYTYNRSSGVYTWNGFITFTRTNASLSSNKGVSVAYYTHTTGTVAVSSTTVTGTGTLFVTQRIAAGARIGFGTTDPTAVTRWYYIQSIGSNTTITLTTTVDSTISSGTSYVIEELRIILADIVAANNVNGGVFIAKGVNYDDFITTGRTITNASAGSADNQKLCYKLADSYRTGGTTYQAGTVSNTSPQTVILDGPRKTDFDGLTHSLYVVDTTSNVRLYVYNIRANDTVTNGIMALTASNILITGAQTIPAGTFVASGLGNIGCLATTNHGPGKGIKSLYFATSTRLYRADVTNLYHAKANWISSILTEVPVGSTNTLAVTATMYMIDYDILSDRFLVACSGLRTYYTKFTDTSGELFGYYVSTYNLAGPLDGSTSDPRSVPLPTHHANNWVANVPLNGITHYMRYGVPSVGTNTMFAVPYSAHWEYANSTNQVAISPVINVSNNDEFVRLVIQDITTLGSDPFSTVINRVRAYCRTAGISDNSGLWTFIDDSGDLSGIEASSQIQFKFEFQIMGNNFNIPPRLLGFNVIYKEIDNDYHFQPSIGKTDAANKRFVWRFSSAFGTTVPTLRVRLYENITNNLLVDDNTSSPSGTFEKSTDGGSVWSSYNSTDKTNETTYIRYKPAYLSDSVNVRPILTLL
jgi:hypothetical protein